MRAVHPRTALTMVLAGLVIAGCGNVQALSQRYRAERLFWQAQRDEVAARLRTDRPDSASILRVRESYLKVAREIPAPQGADFQAPGRKVDRDILTIIANAELQAARLAVMAGRPDLAIDAMRRISNMAKADPIVRRRADFFLVGALRQLKQREAAVQIMREMLKRYPPEAMPKEGEEDPILAIPEAIVRLRREAGDQAGAAAALNEAAAYYRSLLARPLSPLLEAQARARLVRVELERREWDRALRDLDTLQRLVVSTKGLESMVPEIRYSQAKLEAIRTGKAAPDRAVAMLDRVAKDFPDTPFAARATFEAGALLESHDRKREAVERYRIVTTRYAKDPEIAPLGIYRRAMLEAQLGDWEQAKNLFESIPILFPESQAAVEAPMAIVQRYARAGDRNAARMALRQAIGTYQRLVARDTTSVYAPIYRWSILRCNAILDDRPGVIAAAKEMVRRDLGHPLAAEALLEGARAAHRIKQDDTARTFLQTFLASYPASPLRDEVTRELAKLEPRRS